MNHWTLTLGRSTRCLFLYLMVHGKLLGHKSRTLRRLGLDWINSGWTSMREAFSGLYGTRVHVVRLRGLRKRNRVYSGLKSPKWSAKHIFPWSPLCPVCNKGRKHQKMSGILQLLRVASIPNPQQIYMWGSSVPSRSHGVQPVQYAHTVLRHIISTSAVACHMAQVSMRWWILAWYQLANWLIIIFSSLHHSRQPTVTRWHIIQRAQGGSWRSFGNFPVL